MFENMETEWRMRTVISSEVIIEPSEISHDGLTFRIFEINATNTVGGEKVAATHRYCDAILSGTRMDIGEAFSKLYDKLQGLLDRVSFVSYGETSLKAILSICPSAVHPGQTFEIALPQYRVERKTRPISLDMTLPLAEMSNLNERWIRLLRLGLTSKSDEDRYISFYSLLEEIARLEAKETIKNTCPECRFQVDTGRKATNNFIREIFLSHSVDVELLSLAPEYRNKIAHGGGLKDRLFYVNLAKLNSHLEEICLIEIESRIGLRIRNRLNAHIVDIPVITHTAYCENDGTFTLIHSTHRIPARFVRLPATAEDYANQSASVGMPLGHDGRPIIDPYSWPQVVSKTWLEAGAGNG